METEPLASSCTVRSWQIAAGGELSSTVTVASHVLTLPLLSVTVKVTEFGPMSAVVKSVWLNDIEAMPQASDEPLSTSPTMMEAAPFASSCAVTFWQIAVGLTLSSTVTVKVVVLVLLLLSVTVKVTVLSPMWEQSKLV